MTSLTWRLCPAWGRANLSNPLPSLRVATRYVDPHSCTPEPSPPHRNRPLGGQKYYRRVVMERDYERTSSEEHSRPDNDENAAINID